MTDILMDIKEIMQFLPHRPPFLLIDRVIELTPHKSITAIKNVTMNEPFFQGHFPGEPIMPGVLILEAMAQAGAVLAAKSVSEEKRGAINLFAGIDKARFKHMVVPGDQLRIEIEFEKARAKVYKMKGNAYVGDNLACAASLMSARK